MYKEYMGWLLWDCVTWYNSNIPIDKSVTRSKFRNIHPTEIAKLIWDCRIHKTVDLNDVMVFFVITSLFVQKNVIFFFISSTVSELLLSQCAERGWCLLFPNVPEKKTDFRFGEEK